MNLSEECFILGVESVLKSASEKNGILVEKSEALSKSTYILSPSHTPGSIVTLLVLYTSPS